MKKFNKIVSMMCLISTLSFIIFIPQIDAKTVIYTPNNKSLGGQWSLSWSPDGRYLAAASPIENEAFVFEYKTWKRENLASNQSIKDIKFSLDGKYLAYGGLGVPLTILNSQNWKKIKYFPDVSSNVDAISWSPDGRYIAFSYNNTIKVLNTENWQETATIKENYSEIEVSFSHDSRYLACGGIWNVNVYSTDNWSKVANLSVPFGRVHSLIWSPEDDFLLAGMGAFIGGYSEISGIIILWNSTIWKQERMLDVEWANSKEVYSLSWNNEKDILAVGLCVFYTPYTKNSVNISVKLYYTKTWEMYQEDMYETITFSGEFSFHAYSVAWSPDGEHLAVAYKNIAIYGFEENDYYGLLYAGMLIFGILGIITVFVVKYFFGIPPRFHSKDRDEMKPKNEKP